MHEMAVGHVAHEPPLRAPMLIFGECLPNLLEGAADGRCARVLIIGCGIALAAEYSSKSGLQLLAAGLQTHQAISSMRVLKKTVRSCRHQQDSCDARSEELRHVEAKSEIQ